MSYHKTIKILQPNSSFNKQNNIMKNIKFKFLALLTLVICFSNTVMAQLPPGFGDTTIDDTSSPAPISSLVVLGVVVGAVIGYRKLSK